MKVGKSWVRDNLKWSVEYDSEPESDVSEPVNANLIIKFADDTELDYPVTAGVNIPNSNHTAKFNQSAKKMPADERQVELSFTATSLSNLTASDEADSSSSECVEVFFTDAGSEGADYDSPLVSAETANICGRILSGSDTGELKKNINTIYGKNQRLFAYNKLRDQSKLCTDYEQQIEILSFLYNHSDEDGETDDDMFRFFEHKVIKGNTKARAYPAKSIDELERKIQLCSEADYVPRINNKDKLRGQLSVELLKSSVKNGRFDAAREYCEKSIEYLDTSDNDKELTISYIRKQGLEGLIQESNGGFKEASETYRKVAEQVESVPREQTYDVLSRLAEIKLHISNKKYNDAEKIFNQINIDPNDINLLELNKISILIEQLRKYREGTTVSEPHDVFDNLDVSIDDLSNESIIQFNNDYSSGISLLIARQRQKELGVDSGMDEQFHASITDAITPKGIADNGEFNKKNSIRKSEATNSSNSAENTTANNLSENDSSERELVTTERPQRDIRFQKEIKNAYNEKCAICGSQRRTPDGRPEVEAAHIRPVKKGGNDTIDNGIALCRLHHWAFDNGWISIGQDYTVLVKEAPNVNGYSEFRELRGEEIYLPDSEYKPPDKQYLAFHRQHNSFD